VSDLEDRDQHGLGMRAAHGAVAFRNFVRDHHEADGLLVVVIGSLQSGTDEAVKRGVPLAEHMPRQAANGACAKIQTSDG
jgi:hypothetical protein